MKSISAAGHASNGFWEGVAFGPPRRAVFLPFSGVLYQKQSFLWGSSEFNVQRNGPLNRQNFKLKNGKGAPSSAWLLVLPGCPSSWPKLWLACFQLPGEYFCSLPPLAILKSRWPTLLSGRAHRFPLNASGARNARAAGHPTRKVALNRSEIMKYLRSAFFFSVCPRARGTPHAAMCRADMESDKGRQGRRVGTHGKEAPCDVALSGQKVRACELPQNRPLEYHLTSLDCAVWFAGAVSTAHR